MLLIFLQLNSSDFRWIVYVSVKVQALFHASPCVDIELDILKEGLRGFKPSKAILHGDTASDVFVAD